LEGYSGYCVPELRDKIADNNDIFLSERKARAGPVLEKFKAWLEKRKEEVPPSLLLGKAINYSLTQWDKMSAYLESPYLTPDNNACENAIRPFLKRLRLLLHPMTGKGCFPRAFLLLKLTDTWKNIFL